MWGILHRGILFPVGCFSCGGRCRCHLWLLPQVVIPTSSWLAEPSDKETEVWPTCSEGKWAPWIGLWAGALGEVSAVGIAGHKQSIFLGFAACCHDNSPPLYHPVTPGD